MANAVTVNDKKQLVLTVEYDEYTPRELLDLMWEADETKCREWIDKENKFDLDTYEGGITEWWGFGSVFMYEFGVVTTITYDHNTITVTLS